MHSACSIPTLNAGAAFTAAPWPNLRVGLIERVAVLTVRLARVVGRWADTAQNVLSARHGLQVSRVLACAVPAQMVKCHSRRHGANGQFPGHAMRADTSIVPAVELSVPLIVERQEPRPAFVWTADLDLGPESGSDRKPSPSVIVSKCESQRDALRPPLRGVTTPRDRGTLPTAATAEAVAVWPFVGNVGGGGNIGGEHRNLISGGPLGVCRAARGDSVASNYSIGGAP